MKINLVFVCDAHIGSTVALCPPSVTLDDGGMYHASRGQRWIWDNWQIFLDKVAAIEPKPIVVFGGDMVEQDSKRRSYQVITRNPATLNRVAVYILEPLVKMAKTLFVLRGTPAHGGKSGNTEEAIAMDLGAVKDDRTGAYSRYYLPMVLGKLRVDIAHSVYMGERPNMSAENLATKTILRYNANSEEPPGLILRGHQHRWGDSGDAYSTRAIISAGWTLATEYIECRAPGAVAHIGGVIVATDGARWDAEKVKFPPLTRMWVKIR